MRVDRNRIEVFGRCLVLSMAVGMVGCATRLQVSASLLNAAQTQVLPCSRPLIDASENVNCKLPSADKAVGWRESALSLGEHATLHLQPGSVVRIHGSTIVDQKEIKRAGAVPLPFEYRWTVPLLDGTGTSLTKIDSDFVDILLLRSTRSTRGAEPTREIEDVQRTLANKEGAAGRELIVRTAVQTMRVTMTGKHVSISSEQDAEAGRLVEQWKKTAQEQDKLFRPNEKRTEATKTELAPWSDPAYLDALCSFKVLQGNADNQRQYISFLVPVGKDGGEPLRSIESPFEAWASPGTPAKPAAWTGNGTAVVPAQAAIPWTRVEVLVPVYLNDALEPMLLPSCYTLRALERQLNVKVKAIERSRAHATCPEKLVGAGELAATAEAIRWQCRQLDSVTRDHSGPIRISVAKPNILGPSGVVLAPEKLALTWIAPNDRIVVERIPAK